MNTDLEKNTEFRIKWPRGEMGSLPADSEQFMLIEHLASQLEKLAENIETGQAPYDQQQKLTLEFYEKRISKLEERVDELKNKPSRRVQERSSRRLDEYTTRRVHG